MKIATCTADIDITCSIICQYVYVLLPLDKVNDVITKTKYIVRPNMEYGRIIYAGWSSYKRGIPHKITTKSNFSNCIMLSMSMGDGRYASISVYKNKLHICGCKSEEELIDVTKIVVSHISMLNDLIVEFKSLYDDLRSYLLYDCIWYNHNSNAICDRYGDLGLMLDVYLSQLTTIADVDHYLTWLYNVEHCITGTGLTDLNVINSIDIHNISGDVALGRSVELMSVAYHLESHGYDVSYSNIHDNHVHIIIPYDELDDNTKRKKSRFIFNIYKTGAIKIYGPSFYGLGLHTNRLLNILHELF